MNYTYDWAKAKLLADAKRIGEKEVKIMAEKEIGFEKKPLMRISGKIFMTKYGLGITIFPNIKYLKKVIESFEKTKVEARCL